MRGAGPSRTPAEGSHIENRQDVLARLIFALLVAAVFGHVWFASTPLPFGGPNILPAIAAALLAVVLRLWRAAPSLRGGVGVALGARRAFAAFFPKRFRSAAPVLLIAFAMWAWVHVVYLRADTFDSTRAGQFTVGIGVLFASLCVLSARRAGGLIAAIVVAVSLSALFGICVLAVGGPFVDAWLRIAEVAGKDLRTVLVDGRTAGATAHTATFGYHLTVAIPLAFAALILGAPVRWGRWALASDAALLLLLTCMLAALAVNASRSAILGVAVGVCLCVVGAVTAPLGFRHGGVVRLLVVGPLSLLAPLALFNPWFNVGDIVEELRPVRFQGGGVLNLEIGGQALLSDDPHVLGHRFEGCEPGVEYRVGLRAEYVQGVGMRSLRKTKADANGDIVITWRGDPTKSVVGYQFRLRKAGVGGVEGAGGAGTGPVWRSFAPALRSRGVRLAVSELTVGRAALTRGDPGIVGSTMRDLVPGQGYDLQLRAVVDGPLSQASGHADEDGRLVFTWRNAVLPNGFYRCRLRRSPDGPWSVWRRCQPFLPRPPVWPELRDGGETLKPAAGGVERVGHEFAGFWPWRWYLVQIQEVLVDGVARAPRHGEVVFSPRRSDHFVVTWPAPRAPEGISGYRFRTRGVESDWLPWRAFTPSLSGKVPVPVPAGSAAQDGQLIRHTLWGLPPGTRQSVRLRVRSGAVFGAESAVVDGVVAEDGGFALAWRQAPEGSEGKTAVVQFRRQPPIRTRWLPWRDLTPPVDGGRTTVALGAPGNADDEAVNVAHVARRFDGGLPLRRIEVLDSHMRIRPLQVGVAWRYALDHPFGAGVYRPNRSHIGEDVSDAWLYEMLRVWPHNQFLHTMTLYGFPGLCLHLLFYGFLVRAAWRAGRLAWREPRAELRFLVIAAIAAWAAYSVNSLFIPTGPFLQDWNHYFVLGLLLSLEGILAGERR